MHATKKGFWLLAVTAVAFACRPDGQPVGPNSPVLTASRAGVPFTEGLASPEWQDTAASFVAQAKFSPVTASHAYSLVGVAQYLAVQEAETAAGGTDSASEVASGDGIGSGGRNRLETDRGAVAGASAVVLTYLFPTQASAIEDMVSAQANVGPGQPHPAFLAAEAIGRAAGAQIVARAQGDHFDRPAIGTPPIGPGFWTSANPPALAGGQLPGVTPWFLTSADQFRSPPPPAFGSTAFLAALAEIRQLSDTRTAEQTQIAIFWAQNAGTITTPGYWISLGTAGIIEHGLSEREATHLYALLSATMFDAAIACWDTKETYWFIRPSKADPLIKLIPAVGLPNHPSYPSGHSCNSSAAGMVLSAFFPEKSAEIDAKVTQAGLARMYAGIHYRFDIEAGRVIGRSVAAFSMAADASGNSVLTPR